MKRAIKKRSSIYQYLESSGVLDNGTIEEIKAARKKYWMEYKRLWRKDKRRKEKEFTVSFSKDDLQLLTKVARRHKRKRTLFIKTATLAYINKTYIVPDEIEVRQIRQLLSMSYNSLEQQMEEEILSVEAGKVLLQLIQQLEREVLVLLYNPKTLEQWIVETVRQYPERKAQLIQLLNFPSENDCQKLKSKVGREAIADISL